MECCLNPDVYSSKGSPAKSIGMIGRACQPNRPLRYYADWRPYS